MEKIRKMIARLYGNDVVRYVFFGGCTTLVNLVSFYVLRKCGLQLTVANIISIIAAILFAYMVNSKFVFQDKCETLRDHIQPFIEIYQRPSGDYGHRGGRRMASGGDPAYE